MSKNTCTFRSVTLATFGTARFCQCIRVAEGTQSRSDSVWDVNSLYCESATVRMLDAFPTHNSLILRLPIYRKKTLPVSRRSHPTVHFFNRPILLLWQSFILNSVIVEADGRLQPGSFTEPGFIALHRSFQICYQINFKLLSNATQKYFFTSATLY